MPIGQSTMSDLNLNSSDAVPPDADDAQWVALRYVLGELSDEQAETFENAMAEDAALCEAVLQATLLSSTIAVVYESQKSTGPVLIDITSDKSSRAFVASDRSSFVRFGVFTATAAMILVVLAMVMLQSSPEAKLLASDEDATADMLAMLLDNSSASDFNGEFDEFGSTDDSVSSLVAPEWLLTAVDLDLNDKIDEIPINRPEDETGVY